MKLIRILVRVVICLLGYATFVWFNSSTVRVPNNNSIIIPQQQQQQQQQPAQQQNSILSRIQSSLKNVPDNLNPRPLVQTCFEKSTRQESGEGGNQLSSCGKSLPLSSLSSTTVTTRAETTNKIELSLLEQCNDFARSSNAGSNNNGSELQKMIQQIHLEQAAKEECWLDDDNFIGGVETLSIEHPTATDKFGKNHCATGVIFPRQLIGYCQCGLLLGATNEKNISFFFSGHQGTTHPEKRQWINSPPYSNHPNADIQFTSSGRDVRKKTGHYDWDYYNKLRSSEFVLSPDGDFTWTYRFLEAIMCGSIPILDRREVRTNVQEEGYHYCLVDQEPECPYIQNKELRQQAAIENWKNFVRRHTFVSEEW